MSQPMSQAPSTSSQPLSPANQPSKTPSEQAASTEIQSESPFGLQDPSVPEIDSVANVAATGAKWVRCAGRNGMVWDFIEPQKGAFNWTLHDRLYLETYQNNIKLNVVVTAYNKLDSGGREFGYIPKDMNWYLSFLQKAVERYDGDGIDDAPGSPVVDVWEIENEPDLSLNPGGPGFKDTPKNYALLLKKSYKVIKEANPYAKVAFAGLAGPDGIQGFMVVALDELERIKDTPDSRYFDIASFHWSGQFKGDYQKEILPRKTFYLASTVSEVKAEMGKKGYTNIPIWITEMSYNDGKPFDLSFLQQPRTENEQANELLKRYVYSMAKGVGKIFWVTLTEWSNFGGAGVNNYFDNVGLINNPANDGQSHKKLSYYTYRKMIEALEGSDWANIQTIQEKDGVYIYKFIKEGKPVWLAWNDNAKPVTVTIPLADNISEVKITEAVPEYDSGKEVTNYSTAFTVVQRNFQGGSPRQIQFELAGSPVFIEVAAPGLNTAGGSIEVGSKGDESAPREISMIKFIKKVEIPNAARPEIIATQDRVFVLYLGNISNGGNRTFNVQIYNNNMDAVVASQVLVSTTAEYGGPTDIRVAADDGFLYAFYETNKATSPTTAITYLWGAKYTLDDNFNRVAYTIKPITNSKPMPELQEGGELVDDPAPLVGTTSVYVVTRLKYSLATNGKTFYRVRGFSKDGLAKQSEFDLDLSSVADGRGRVTSLLFTDNSIYMPLATTISNKGIIEGNDDGALSDIILVKMRQDWTFDPQKDVKTLSAEPDDRENYVTGFKSLAGYFFITYKQAVAVPPGGEQIAWIKIFDKDFHLVLKEKVKSVKWVPDGGEIRPSLEITGDKIFSGQSGGLGIGKGNAEVYIYNF